MSADYRKFKLLSLTIIFLDVVQQALGWIFIIGYYIYKTPSCTYQFYSDQCCPQTDSYYDSLTCQQAKQIQYQFIVVIVCPLAIYILFLSLFVLSCFFCSTRKYLALRFSQYLMLMCTFGSKTIFFMLFAEVPMLATKTKDDEILVIKDVCIELLIQLFLKLFLLLGICCEVNDSEFWQQHEMKALKPIVMQTVLINIDHPYDKISQGESKYEQFYCQEKIFIATSLINQPILGWPVEGQAVNK